MYTVGVCTVHVRFYPHKTHLDAVGAVAVIRHSVRTGWVWGNYRWRRRGNNYYLRRAKAQTKNESNNTLCTYNCCCEYNDKTTMPMNTHRSQKSAVLPRSLVIVVNPDAGCKYCLINWNFSCLLVIHPRHAYWNRRYLLFDVLYIATTLYYKFYIYVYTLNTYILGHF